MTQETKHTAGPWRFTNGIVPRISTPNGQSICGMHKRGIQKGDFSQEEFEANGHLIKAAPDLLGQALRFEKSLEYQINVYVKKGDDEGAKLLSFTLIYLRETIAKARGQS